MKNKLMDIVSKTLSSIRHVFAHKWIFYSERYNYKREEQSGNILIEIRECKFCKKRQHRLMKFRGTHLKWREFATKKRRYIKI